ncbi:MAG: succinylglutamate desuccinylase/aspartoacylase family protein [Campylobacterales bacterium]|nr:succinylglutamate desuccinylase/aspartoacylase family protein [Campylobacterales bacterium]
MITTEIFASELPVSERLSIKRTRFGPNKLKKGAKRISIVSGIHGDELEGQYVIFLLAEWLKKHPEALLGTVDLYPAVNSLGLDAIIRSFPLYEVDLNRTFPGGKEDFLPGQVVHALSEDVKGSDIAIDIHSSNIFLREIPQIRINAEFGKTLIPLAKQLNCDFIWVHGAVTVLEATFSHTMNTLGTKTLVVEMGVGMRVTQEYGRQLLHGILNLMKNEGLIETDETFEQRTPYLAEGGEVMYLNAPRSGLFIPTLEHCAMIQKGDLIGRIVDPLSGSVRASIKSPGDGILFTLREYPVVYEGSLIARILGGVHEEN